MVTAIFIFVLKLMSRSACQCFILSHAALSINASGPGWSEASFVCGQLSSAASRGAGPAGTSWDSRWLAYSFSAEQELPQIGRAAAG